MGSSGSLSRSLLVDTILDNDRHCQYTRRIVTVEHNTTHPELPEDFLVLLQFLLDNLLLLDRRGGVLARTRLFKLGETCVVLRQHILALLLGFLRASTKHGQRCSRFLSRQTAGTHPLVFLQSGDVVRLFLLELGIPILNSAVELDGLLLSRMRLGLHDSNESLAVLLPFRHAKETYLGLLAFVLELDAALPDLLLLREHLLDVRVDPVAVFFHTTEGQRFSDRLS